LTIILDDLRSHLVNCLWMSICIFSANTGHCCRCLFLRYGIIKYSLKICTWYCSGCHFSLDNLDLQGECRTDSSSGEYLVTRFSETSVVIDYGQTCQTQKVNKITQSIYNWSGLLTHSQQTNDQTNIMARNGVMMWCDKHPTYWKMWLSLSCFITVSKSIAKKTSILLNWSVTSQWWVIQTWLPIDLTLLTSS